MPILIDGELGGSARLLELSTTLPLQRPLAAPLASGGTTGTASGSWKFTREPSHLPVSARGAVQSSSRAILVASA